MRSPGTSLFCITVTIIGLTVFLVPGPAQAQEPYVYQDDFSDNWAESHSYLHSVFWPQGAFPPPQPYLYFVDSEFDERELGFGDRHGQPAFLGYRFPTGPPQARRAVSGSLQLDVRFPYAASANSSLSGYLLYSVSDDGVTWSASEELMPGSHDIPLASVRGTCHIVFFGTEVLIDNLRVRLSAAPATIYVPGQYGTIQAAIDAATDGDIIQVSSGTYSGPGNRDIYFAGKAITLRSADGPGKTIIDCGGHRGFHFRGSEGPDSVLRGFTIRGGRAPGAAIPSDDDNWKPSSSHPVGGGIFCEFSSPTIVNCVIEDCASELGGGVGVVGGAPRIFDCVIEQCRAGGAGSAQSRGYGAGIGLIRGADAKIYNCAISDNVAYSEGLGAGVYCWRSRAMLVNCSISDNSAQVSVAGGGLYCGGADASIVAEKCLIADNTAQAGGGILADQFDYMQLANCTVAGNRLSGAAASSAGGIDSSGGDITIRNSIVWHNDGQAISLVDSTSANPVLFSDIEGNYPGQGNINVDPLFASPATGDYHLKSFTGRYEPRWDRWVAEADIRNHSPCIDAGDPQDPVGAETFPNANRINMGAYGGTAYASRSIGPLIFHVDGSNGSNYNTGLSKRDAFKTIQHAVNYALDGDIVLVWPGVYREEVMFEGKAITIQSADEAAVITAPSPTTGYAFTFSGAEASRSVVRNFVILNCGLGAVYCVAGSPTLTNLTIVSNPYGIVAVDGANPSITSCIFWNNTDGDLFQCRARFSLLQELRGQDAEYGNISTDPLFADPANGDYHLKSRYGRYSTGSRAWVTDAVTSPCIDAGDPAVYPGRERMPHGGIVNMGAYGGTPFASLSGWQSWDSIERTVQSNPVK